MEREELTKQWNSTFPNFLPIADELKNYFKKRWFRIHTLPESKRYAENKEEYKEIFRRHNLVLSDLFGVNHKYFLLTFGYGSNPEKPAKDKIVERLNLQTNYWMSIDVADEDDKTPFYWHIYFDENSWVGNSMNKLFCLIADDEIGNVMFFSAEKKIVYHPYDGGADIFFENSKLRDFYKEKYKDWLSIHPSGL